MIWGNPWAWLGLVTIALPVLIHLLGRGHARVQRFPTLRFLEASRLLPTRRTRVHDLWLLITRAGILAASVAALAQPTLRTASRTRALGRTLARAIVLDTSTSMQRATPTGGRAIDGARREAQRLASEAQSTTLIETRTPSRAVAAAVDWLSRQPGRGELVVVSDFQSGALDSVDVARVPREIGVRLARVAVSESGEIRVVARSGDIETVARTTLSPSATSVEWSTRPAPAQSPSDLLLLAGPNERAGADASMRAASILATRLPMDTGHVVAIVYPQYPERAEALRGATAPHSPWATDFVARLRSDSLLISAASSATVSSAADTTGALVVARSGSGVPVVSAKQDSASGRDRLLLFSFADAGSLTSAALIAATTHARSTAAPLAELDPALLSDATLASWQRAPAADAPARHNVNTGPSDGRWLWILALALLVLETWLRRSLPISTARAQHPAPGSSDRAA